jgi:2-polyprenyl-3-methyl-5-hydroxy-6-metoxy-1,4-benzoquinol methylase
MFKKIYCPICKKLKVKTFLKGNMNNNYNNKIDVRCTSMSNNLKPTLYKCKNCYIVFSQFVNKKFENLYKDVVDKEYLKQIRIKKKSFENFLDTIKLYINKDKDVLEIGSYYGVLGSLIKNKVKSYTGIEYSKSASKYAIKKFDLKIKSHFNQLRNKKYDLIILCDVIEHVDNPLEVLKQIKSVLKKNGVIIMTTMDIESFYAKILGINYPWIMPMHKFYFSFSSLKFILKKEKLKIDTYYHEKKITSLGYLLKKISIILFGRLFNKINFDNKYLNQIDLKINFFDLKIFIIK